MLGTVKSCGLAGALLCLCAGTSVDAEEADGNHPLRNDGTEISIAFGDLDLTSHDGQGELRARIRKAASALCKRQPIKLPLYRKIQQRQCIGQTEVETEPQVALAIAKANEGPALASAGAAIVVIASSVR